MAQQITEICFEFPCNLIDKMTIAFYQVNHGAYTDFSAVLKTDLTRSLFTSVAKATGFFLWYTAKKFFFYWFHFRILPIDTKVKIKQGSCAVSILLSTLHFNHWSQ